MGISAAMLIVGVKDEEATMPCLRFLSGWACAAFGDSAFYSACYSDDREWRGAVRYPKAHEPGRGLVISNRVYRQCCGAPDIIAAPGECLLWVAINTRYYGVDYERGDARLICRVAEWCENVGRPWYGGDSLDTPLEPFPAEKRLEMMDHFKRAGRYGDQ